MRPGTAHAVVTVEDCLAVGGHFYSNAAYELTLKCLMHEHYAGTEITNASHPTAPVYAMKTLGYYHSWMLSQGKDGWQGKFAPRFDAYRLASLLVLNWYAPELPPKMPYALESEKTHEERWFKSNEKAHDAWRASALARHIFESHDLDLQEQVDAIEKRFLNRARLTREGLDPRLRLKPVEKMIGPLVDKRARAALDAKKAMVEFDDEMDIDAEGEDEVEEDEQPGKILGPGVKSGFTRLSPLPHEGERRLFSLSLSFSHRVAGVNVFSPVPTFLSARERGTSEAPNLQVLLPPVSPPLSRGTSMPREHGHRTSMYPPVDKDGAS